MLLNKEVGTTVPFSDFSVLSDYSAVTGFDPADPATDQGTDVQDAATYRRVTGLLDANGGIARLRIDSLQSDFEIRGAVAQLCSSVVSSSARQSSNPMRRAASR